MMSASDSIRRYAALLSLLAMLSACGHRAPDSLMLIEVHEDLCPPEACVGAAARLKKLLTVQLALRSDCAGIHAFTSRDEWMVANTPPNAKHWTLTVSQSLAQGSGQPTWLLSGPGKNYRGTGDPSQIIKEICILAD
jgi:hypothetical protein